MKKVHYLRLFACAAILTATVATSAAAAEVTANTPMLISAEETVSAQYLFVEGTVESVEAADEEGYVTVTLNDGLDGLVCHVPAGAFVVSSMNGTYSAVADLKAGDEVKAVLNGNAPMTMSLPPQTAGVVGFVKMDGGSADLSVYNSELVNAGNSLKLNIGEETVITDLQGSRILRTAEDLKGKELLVCYNFSTRSIPAQTTPTFVMLLSAEEASAEYVGLRSLAEGKGYTVTWTGHNNPILLEKEDGTLAVTIGSDSLTVNGEAVTLSMETVLKDGVTMVSSEIEVYL